MRIIYNMNIPDWLLYELQVVKYHNDMFGQTWHWSNCPEDVLYESGFIHDFNKYRLVKLQKKSEGVCNSLREYGLDGMCRRTFLGRQYR